MSSQQSLTFQLLALSSDLTPPFSRAEHVTKLSAICSTCHGDAAFFFKNDPDLGNQGSDLIGGTDKYTATCRPCYKTRPKPLVTGNNNNVNTDVLNNTTMSSSGPKPVPCRPKAALKSAMDSGALPKPKRVRFGPSIEDFKTPQLPPLPPAELHPNDVEFLWPDDIPDDLLYWAAVAHIPPEDRGSSSVSL